MLSGCVPVSRPEPPSRDCWSDAEQLAERTRFLPGVDEDGGLAAAGRVLRLAHGDDASVIRAAHQLSAQFSRDRWIYLFLYAHRAVVHEQWLIATRPEPGGSRACVQVTGHYFTDTFVLGAEPMLNAVYPASAPAAAREVAMPPATPYAVDFETFWARVEYFAGLRTDWAACPSEALRENAARGRTEINPLCHRLADDRAPE